MGLRSSSRLLWFFVKIVIFVFIENYGESLIDWRVDSPYEKLLSSGLNSFNDFEKRLFQRKTYLKYLRRKRLPSKGWKIREIGENEVLAKIWKISELWQSRWFKSKFRFSYKGTFSEMKTDLGENGRFWTTVSQSGRSKNAKYLKPLFWSYHKIPPSFHSLTVILTVHFTPILIMTAQFGQKCPFYWKCVKDCGSGRWYGRKNSTFNSICSSRYFYQRI